MLVGAIVASLRVFSPNKGSYKGSAFVTRVSFATVVGAIRHSATLCPITCAQCTSVSCTQFVCTKTDAQACVLKMQPCSTSGCLLTPGQWPLFYSYLPVSFNEHKDMFMALR